jgi:hypothetical protein
MKRSGAHPARLIVVWLFVILPLAWGVTQSARKAAPLFRTEEPGRETGEAAGGR